MEKRTPSAPTQGRAAECQFSYEPTSLSPGQTGLEKIVSQFCARLKKSASKRIRELIPGKNDIAFSFKSEYLLQVIVNDRAEVRQISFRFIESLLCLILDNRRSSYLAPKNVERENFVENDFATAKSNHLDIGR